MTFITPRSIQILNYQIRTFLIKLLFNFHKLHV